MLYLYAVLLQDAHAGCARVRQWRIGKENLTAAVAAYH